MGDGIMLRRIMAAFPKFTFTPTDPNAAPGFTFISDGHGDWRIKFLTSGTLVFGNLANASRGIDVFLVGGGAGGASWVVNPDTRAAGGGGGYTKTERNVTVTKGTSYAIVVGAAGFNNAASSGSAMDGYSRGSNGGDTTAFGYTANGGGYGRAGHAYYPETYNYGWAEGGNGGSGGGTRATFAYNGGTDGGNGDGADSSHGRGQGTTTREFGEAGGDLYASGGGSYTPHVDNSGNGGCVWWTGNGWETQSIAASSGIVVIRNHRE